MEKFVEIGTGDCEKFHAVQERQIRPLGLIEDTLVEFQPRKFAVDVGDGHGSGFFDVKREAEEVFE